MIIFQLDQCLVTVYIVQLSFPPQGFSCLVLGGPNGNILVNWLGKKIIKVLNKLENEGLSSERLIDMIKNYYNTTREGQLILDKFIWDFDMSCWPGKIKTRIML